MKPQYPFNINDLTITLSRTGDIGYGPCYDLRIKGNGEISFIGYKYGIQMNRIDDHLSKEQIADIYRQAIKIDFFLLRSNYYDEPDILMDEQGNIQLFTTCPTCFPEDVLTIQIGAKKKTVRSYFGAPQTVLDLMDFIDSTVKTDRWTATISATL